MWMFTEIGFYSIVENGFNRDEVLVRSRVHEDLRQLLLCTKHLRPLDAKRPIVETPEADYPFRVVLRKSEWERCAAFIAGSINYGNFKNAVAADDKPRATLYGDVWSVLAQGLHHLRKKGSNA